MADKSFEQLVQEQMADLRIKPDDTVWVGVKAALHREKKRRWLTWLFLLLTGCSGASFWIYYQLDHPQPNLAAKQIMVLAEKTPAKEKQPIGFSKKKQMGEIIQTHPSAKLSGNNKKEEAGRSHAIRGKGQNILSLHPILEPVKGPSVSKNKMAIQEQRPMGTGTPAITQTSIAEKPVAAVQMATAPGLDTISVTNKTQTAQQTLLPEMAHGKGDTLSMTDKKNTKYKWQWLMAVDAGSSGMRSSLSDTRKIYTQSYSNATGLYQNTMPVLNDAISFGIELQAHKQIGNKHSMGISLGYALFQTSTSVGHRIDSTTYFSGSSSYNTSGYYYNSADSIGYTNQYHFVQAGLNLYTPFRLFKSIRIRWQVGAGLAVLLGSNGLHYDDASGSLFRNNSLITKVQTQFSTGFDVPIGKQPFLYVGPQWQYFISHFSKQSGVNEHLFLSAIKISVVFPRNKK